MKKKEGRISTVKECVTIFCDSH